MALTYNNILADKVVMPGRMQYSLDEFACRIANRLARENRELIPDTELIDLLCNAAWLGCEQIELLENIRGLSKDSP